MNSGENKNNFNPKKLKSYNKIRKINSRVQQKSDKIPKQQIGQQNIGQEGNSLISNKQFDYALSHLIIEANQQTDKKSILEEQINKKVLKNSSDNNDEKSIDRLKSISNYEIKKDQVNDPKISIKETLDLNNNATHFPKSKSYFNWINLKMAKFNIKNDSKFIKPEINIWLNGNFKLSFDLPTPRPHFIITKIKKDTSKPQGYENSFLANSNDIIRVFELCFNFLNSVKEIDFKKSNIILSVHTGCFCSTKQFHVHLSVDEEEYKKFFDKKCSELLNFQPTKQWDIKTGSVKSAYISNVELYPKKQLDKYKTWTNEDIKKIESENFSKDLNGINELKGVKDADVFLHSSLPKIGFKARNKFFDDINKNCFILQLMAKYAFNRGYFTKPGGSHLCIFLNNKSNFDVDGYILTNGLEYYKLFDVNHQVHANTWMQNFKNQTYFVET